MTKEEVKELINRRRRQVLVHSFLYYRLDTSIISDHVYDQWSKELAELQEKFPEEAKECVFHDDFKDFDGSSGFDLPLGDPWVHNSAMRVLRIHKNKKQ